MEVNVYFNGPATEIDMGPREFSVIPATGAAGADGTDGVGIVSIVKTGTSGLVDTYTVTMTDGSTSTFTVKNGQDGEDGQPGRDGTIENLDVAATTLPTGSQATASYENNLLTLGIPRGNTGATGGIGPAGPRGETGPVGPKGEPGDVTVESESGPASIVSVDNAAQLDALNVMVAIEPVQAGSGDPSPTNVRPISGWTGANVTRTGKNLLPPQMAQGTSSIVALGQSDATSFGTFLKAGTYTISVQSSKSFAFYYRAENGTENVHIGGYDVTSATFTLTKDLRIRLYAYLNTGLSVSDISNPQLELGSTATDYEPYQGDTYDIAFPTEAGTVYGGTVDVTNGVLTVDRAMVTFNGGSSEQWWLAQDYTNCFGNNNTGTFCDGIVEHQISNWLKSSSCGKTSFTFGLKSNGSLYICLDASADQITEAQFRAYLASTPLQIVYTLATPVEYTVTPHDIALLRGTNNVWADCGDTSLRYFLLGVEDIISEIDAAGIPAGGTTGQVLKKKSGTDYDTEWANESGGGGGGTWGSITGTLSNQTDLQTALDEKAKKAINFDYTMSYPLSVGTWSNAAVNAGETSGGSCYYRVVDTSQVSNVTIYHKFSCSFLIGFSGVVYITPQNGSIRIETAEQPASSYRIVGTFVEGTPNTSVCITKIIASISGLTNDAGYLVPSDISALTTYSHDEVTAYGLTIAFTRYGGVVMANCYSGTLSQAISMTVIYTIPEKYRPMNNYDTVNAVSGGTTIQRVIFNANGELSLNFSASAGTAIRFSATYLAQGLAPNT